jgi:hypothetical protein
MASEIAKRVDELERRADRLLGVLKFATRAFVIEFAGSPKSGKSTSVEAIRHFFVRQGFRVHILVERASVCPIPMKGHLFFNTWCASTMLAELLANVETDTDIIIVDRGLFDALVWLTLQRQRGELTGDEAQIIENFLLLERWRTLIDLAVLMRVKADEAIKRELAPRISRKVGSIMNPDILSGLERSVVAAAEKYGHQFRGTYVHETSGEGVRSSNIRLAESILDHFEEFLDPEILVVPKGELSKLPIQGIGEFSPDAKEAIGNCISMFGTCLSG